MLGQIAFNTFVNGEYFFRQENLQRQIKDYICNLPEASADPDVLRLDSEVVLKAIEHHHGLLVERARNIYSFSHLTFQEYFAAREIERTSQLETLMLHITDPRWEEVFLLTAEMLRSADYCLKLMKMQIDTLLTKDKNLQAFLFWAEQKTASVQTKYKTVVVRAFYNYVVIYSYAIALTKPNDSLDFDNSPDFDNFDAMDDATNQCRDLISILAPNLDFERDPELDLDLNLSCALTRDLDFDLDSELDLDFDLAVNCAKYLKDNVLLQSLQLLGDKLPNIEENTKHFSRWWHINGDAWNKELRQICIDHRNIGHDWQFTNDQVELLEQYYSANLLLVDCMNRSYVSKQIREEIESTMLLPSKK